MTGGPYWIVRLKCRRPGFPTSKWDYIEEREVWARTKEDAIALAAENAEGEVLGCESAKARP